MAKPKTPKFGAEAKPKKKPFSGDPVIDGEHPLAWRFGQTDKGGPFAWDIQPDAKFREVMHKLSEFEAKNWSDITRAGSHPIPTPKLCAEAQKRLVETEMDDLDELVSLRLTGDNRVWCAKNGHILRALWWDEKHQVCPTPKDRGDRKKANRRKGT